MNRPTPYNVNVAWVDPTERKTEARAAERCKAHFLITITVPHQPTGKNMVGPGAVQDISLEGVLVLTKHQLAENQRCSLAISTDFCADSLGLPLAFMGPGHVVRTTPVDDRRTLAAIRFGQPLRDNLEFAVFMEYARSLAGVMSI